MMRWILWVIILFGGLLIAPVFAQDETNLERETAVQDRFFYTYQQASGNRVIDGTGTFPNAQMIEIQLAGKPSWAVGYALETVVWHVVLENGNLQIIELTQQGELRSVTVEPAWFAPRQPLTVGVSPIEGAYVFRNDAQVSALTHPVPVNDVDLLYIAANRDVVLAREGGQMSRQVVNALHDGRIVQSSDGMFAVFVDGTNERYVHGIMGDDLEGSGLVILQAQENILKQVGRVDLTGEDVFEGLSPIWADVNGDGIDDLIVTVSNGRVGAWIRVYLFDGEQITGYVDGPAIGQGNRWRHQLAWGAFGPNGENELVDVLTPHIGGTVEFFRFQNNALEIVEKYARATSHPIGSRNLDMGVGGDFDGDGQLEIALLNQERTAVMGVQHNAEGASEVWSLDAGAEIVTNLAPVMLTNGQLAMSVGTEDGRLRIWLPTDS